MSDYRRRLLEVFDQALEREAATGIERFEEGRRVGRADGTQEERQATVRALRVLARDCARDGDPAANFLEDLALRFEAGEHRK